MSILTRQRMEKSYCLSLLFLVLCSVFFTATESSEIENSLTCSLCKLVMTGLDEAILDPTNEQEIRDWLLQVCNYITGQFETICQEFILEYTDDIIESVVGGYLDPDTVCTAISACP
ncbi:prosaposin [Eurytemora carolleeae]|uniref:prosaposin n=1 Tax=Eurytemora carolleeae TaxID=1294199 RepID=UPI000C76BB2D|nr:prosaposin [Eurytemora carolleeae]|eukprot:XP_023321653.1 prosaposin-like [Eurytemora affinis]